MFSTFYDFTRDMVFSHHYTDVQLYTDFHFHLHYEFLLIKQGAVFASSNGIDIKAEAPCILLYQPNVFHSSKTDATKFYESYKFQFSANFINNHGVDPADISKLFDAPFRMIKIDQILMDKIDNLVSLLDTYTDKYCSEAILAMILTTTYRYLNRNPQKTESTEQKQLKYIKDVVYYIENNFHEALTAESLAKKFFISPQKLTNDFKKQMKTTLKQYVLDIKNANAAQMLANGISPIEVSYECGFVNQSHFIKTFRARIGVTPSKYSKKEKLTQFQSKNYD